ncbi:di-heme-cytochrome C peroxidase [Sphingomonas sp. Leaf339]|uniref:di-heme-cytochrome C peroxidase n=1 Tax=Sphingomonas sp. Leaf339 TaxID=1736343 RepID=UPI000A596953|nr:di-heme-cytochrome C peroxidase [Sphingomonas sp. Leaf339]
MTISRARGSGSMLLAFGAIATFFTAAACGRKEPVLGWNQGWSPTEQRDWYSATQGSRLLPLAWFRALERADAPAPFADPTHLAGYRLLPGAENNLPLGFAVDDNDDTDLGVSKLRWFTGQSSRERWVGLNCSACHTAQIEFGDKSLRIDGGPSLFDYQRFVEDFDRALTATRTDPAKFDRFAKSVLTTSDTSANRDLLRAALGKLIDWENRVETINATPLRYGFGRVDAFGHIFNKVALFSGAAQPTPNPADAPVSYPFIWDIYRHDKLQWNGIVSNARLSLGGGRYLDYGAMGRNSGEVIGVFGDVVTRPGNGLGGYKSSLWADNLIRLETQLSTLKAPAWPVQLFGAIDDTDAKRAMIAAGKTQFGVHCATCHAPQPGTAPYKVTMVPLTATDPNATDPWMACNAITYRSATGNLAGTPAGYIGGGEKLGADAPLAEMLETTVKGAMLGKKGQIIGQTARVFFGIGGRPRVVITEAPDQRPEILRACLEANSPFMAYKARPLDGIWATAPYLHNGSVANLYELLLPPARRHKTFKVGTRMYDPTLVGYSTRDDAPGNGFTYDTSLPGNANIGHDYGAATLTADQRQALLAYLKTL